MKKAKVSKGVVRMVWPWTKTLPDGTKVVKEFPYPTSKPLPDCFVDVPDDVEPGWVWNGEAYAPRIKPKPLPQRDWLLEVIAKKLKTTPEKLKDAAKKLKRDAIDSQT